MKIGSTLSDLATFSLAWNSDPRMIPVIDQLNKDSKNNRAITEVFGSLPDAPIPSARPTTQLPNISWHDFEEQIRHLSSIGVEFNFLFNTGRSLNNNIDRTVLKYVDRLSAAGIKYLTVGTPDQISALKVHFPEMNMVLSITYCVRTQAQVKKAISSGADALYLDATYVNRDFPLLRSLLYASTVECRLYANTSCISRCPVIKEHYSIFADQNNNDTAKNNEAFYCGCSLVKIMNPVEWIQTPWIRPEDINVYSSEGIKHFKLSDRLAEFETLKEIAESYMIGSSPANLFRIIERKGKKYRQLLGNREIAQLEVKTKSIPHDFINHFQTGDCSANSACIYCRSVANRAIKFNYSENRLASKLLLTKSIPQKLINRSLP